MEIIFVILAIVPVVLMVWGIVWVNIREREDFNNGICPNCGTPLRHFDDDSQGGQGWCCDRCTYTTWISWFKM